MDYYSKLTITFFFFIIFFVSASSKCFQTNCGPYEPDIKSPFWITGLQPASCGYLIFSLSCNRESRTILNLPHSGEFNVESIYYGLNVIALSDPNNCLALKLLTLNLSTTPFQTVYYENYTFFNCSRVEVDSVYNAYVISCLSGSNYSVTATSSADVIRHFLTTCMVIKKVKFPIYSTYLTSDTFGGKLLLSWDIPYCRGCKGRCDYKNTSTLETTCIHLPKEGSNKAPLVATIIGVVIIALVVGVYGIPCYLSCASPEITTAEVIVGDTASLTVVVTATTGLDMDTLNSYTKVILGESCRLPNPEDDTCSICMSKYEPKDTIKSIPECSHYFHVDCIDEWLRRNATCPFCRTSPLPKIF